MATSSGSGSNADVDVSFGWVSTLPVEDVVAGLAYFLAMMTTNKIATKMMGYVYVRVAHCSFDLRLQKRLLKEMSSLPQALNIGRFQPEDMAPASRFAHTW